MRKIIGRSANLDISWIFFKRIEKNKHMRAEFDFQKNYNFKCMKNSWI